MRAKLVAMLVVAPAVVVGVVRADDPGSKAGAGTETRRPNIVVILADDMGYADVGFNGCGDIPTPNIDSLAAGGVCCANGYVSGPYCSPTRAGLLTGRYQQRFGHEFNPGGGGAGREFGLPTSETTIADRLRAAGYRTGLVGKWHLGESPKFHPQKRGFDEFFGFLGGAHPYFPGQGAPIYRGTEIVHGTEYLTDAFAREAAAFIKAHKDHPFFLYLAFNAVHTPMDATDARLARFASIPDESRRHYAAMLSAMDEGVGTVLGALRSADLDEETLVVFLSDNGGPTLLGTTINGSSNHPFRGSKRTTLEGGIHVPFVLRWKGTLPAGASYESPVIQLDILPTALAAAGAPVERTAAGSVVAEDAAGRNDRPLDGVNLLPYLKGEKTGTPHETLFWRLGTQTAIRRGDWKLVRYDSAVDTPGKPSVPARQEVTAPRLYNLASDPGEQNDLASEQPNRVRELLNDWTAWSSQLADPLWGPRVPQNQTARPAD
jgi:arylsulfatase A-like enzyme